MDHSLEGDSLDFLHKNAAGKVMERLGVEITCLRCCILDIVSLTFVHLIVISGKKIASMQYR